MFTIFLLAGFAQGRPSALHRAPTCVATLSAEEALFQLILTGLM